MTRRTGFALATVSLALFAVGAWLVAGVRGIGAALADVVNGR